MKPMHVCIPVLRRYDLLRGLLESLSRSTVEPAGVFILNNGLNGAALFQATDCWRFPIIVQTPSEPMGIAESWNWFIDHVPEERIITNDDIVFAPESLAAFAGTTGKDIVWAREAGFSCFLIRDSCVKKVGMFDESISPGYGYWEDEDYAMRLDRKGKGPKFAECGDVVCGVEHLHSKTLEVATPTEMEDHHRRFWIAQQNYVEKWGLQEEYRKGLEGFVK